jgi:hypothetical protein
LKLLFPLVLPTICTAGSAIASIYDYATGDVIRGIYWLLVAFAMGKWLSVMLEEFEKRHSELTIPNDTHSV